MQAALKLLPEQWKSDIGSDGGFRDSSKGTTAQWRVIWGKSKQNCYPKAQETPKLQDYD